MCGYFVAGVTYVTVTFLAGASTAVRLLLDKLATSGSLMNTRNAETSFVRTAL